MYYYYYYYYYVTLWKDSIGYYYWHALTLYRTNYFIARRQIRCCQLATLRNRGL